MAMISRRKNLDILTRFASMSTSLLLRRRLGDDCRCQVPPTKVKLSDPIPITMFSHTGIGRGGVGQDKGSGLTTTILFRKLRLANKETDFKLFS